MNPLITNPVTHQGCLVNLKPHLITWASFITTNTWLYIVYMSLCGSAIFLKVTVLSWTAAEARVDGRCQKAQTRRGGPENGPEIQWNLTSMFPLDVKMKCNTDINVASITTQQRNVNWSTGTSGWKLTSCSRIPPPSYSPKQPPPPPTARYAQASAFHHGWPGALWLFLGVKVSSYSSGEGAELIFFFFLNKSLAVIRRQLNVCEGSRPVCESRKRDTAVTH